jgi:hypothetical protein
MLSHSEIVTPRDEQTRTSDTHPLAPQYALQRASLRESPLAPLCLPALERLVDYSQHRHKEAHHAQYNLPHLGEPDEIGLASAAAEVLRCYQIKLAELESADPLPVGIAISLWKLGSLARYAHFFVRCRKWEIKEIELEASKGKPRAICVGTSFTFSLPAPAAEVFGKSTVETDAFGCFRIFPDTTHSTGGGSYWSVWCGNCAPNTGQVLRSWRTRITQRWVDHALELRARP